LNISDGEGVQRWREAGCPTVPALVVAGRAVPVLHVSQIAAALGLPQAPSGDPQRDGTDAAVILEAWLGHIHELDWETLLRPTPSRGRSLRNLTVNVFHPFELLSAAWTTHRFDWQPEADHIRETAITNTGVLYRFAEHTAADWQQFLNNVGDRLGSCDPVVSSPRADVAFSVLLSSQRWHAAYHYRQLLDVLDKDGLDLSRFEDLALPNAIF
jgi:hypothetical protein